MNAAGIFANTRLKTALDSVQLKSLRWKSNGPMAALVVTGTRAASSESRSQALAFAVLAVIGTCRWQRLG